MFILLKEAVIGLRKLEILSGILYVTFACLDLVAAEETKVPRQFNSVLSLDVFVC